VLLRARGAGGRRRTVGRKGIATDQGGTAAIEMTLLLPFALMIFLVITQAAILFNGNMVVHYSGFAASRVAIVVVPMEIGEELKNLVYNPDWAGNPPSEKLELIRRAAVLALVPVSGPLAEAEAVPGAGGAQAVEGQTRTLFSFFGSDDPWWFRRIQRQYNYANKFTTLTLARPGHWRDGNPDPDCPYRHHYRDAWTQWGWSYVPYCPFHPERMDYGYWEDLHLRIVYPFLLEVPVANRVMGEKFDLPGRQGNSYATEIKVISTLSNEGGPEVRPKD
ncbi:MAG: TadE family protein, partial [Phycisphaerae bacterium]